MNEIYVYGRNLEQKERHKSKYRDKESRRYLREIRRNYDAWKKANAKLKGPFSTSSDDDQAIIERRVQLLNEYKDFIDQQKYAEKFDSRSNLHSTVLEEFIFYLFRDLVAEFSDAALIGRSHTLKDIFFMPSSYKEMLERPNARIEKKDHDFVIGANIHALLFCAGNEGTTESHVFQVPAVAIECKTYLDKTMLEGASAAAAQLKSRNPNALYVIVSEWLKLTTEVNLKKFKVDQIYVFRKQKNIDREFRYLDSYTKNPVYADVVHHLFDGVRQHLTSSWEGGVEYGLGLGYLLF